MATRISLVMTPQSGQLDPLMLRLLLDAVAAPASLQLGTAAASAAAGLKEAPSLQLHALEALAAVCAEYPAALSAVRAGEGTLICGALWTPRCHLPFHVTVL